jgi:hypothetical protein
VWKRNPYSAPLEAATLAAWAVARNPEPEASAVRRVRLAVHSVFHVKHSGGVSAQLLNVSADNECMSTGQVIDGYRIVQPSNHYRIVRGTVYRDAAAVRLADGELRLVSFPDHKIGGAA